MDFEKIGGHNAAVRGYILRMLVKGYHNALAVRRISNCLVRDGLASDPDILEPLKYLYDMGFIEFTNKKITPDTAYEQDGVARLTTKGVRFIEGGGDPESGIDLRWVSPGSRAQTQKYTSFPWLCWTASMSGW